VIYCSAVTVLELPASAPGLVYRRLHWSSKTVGTTVGHSDDVSDDVVHTWPVLTCLDEPLCTRLHNSTPGTASTSAVEQARSAVTRHQHVSALALELHKYATTAPSNSSSSSSGSSSSSSSSSNKQWARALVAERLESHFIVGRVTRTVSNGRRDGCYLVLVQRAVPAGVPSVHDSASTAATAAAAESSSSASSGARAGSAASGSRPATATAAATAAVAMRPLTAGSRPTTAAARPLTASGQVYDADSMDLALLGALCR
jgi:hypothetical protein